MLDVSFPALGPSLPLDHGYPLFSSLARLAPSLHVNPSWGVHPVHGRRSGPSTLALTAASRVVLRLPAEHIAAILPLVGATLDVAGHRLHLGHPQMIPLAPATQLSARLVTIKGFFDQQQAFAESVQRQLAAMELEDVEVEVGMRRVVKVHGKLVVGFPCVLSGLTPAASLLVQSRGIGGRRHMGAGVFLPHAKTAKTPS
jgi:CRISPR-associated protein Cas6